MYTNTSLTQTKPHQTAFPFAPEEWCQSDARQIAHGEGIDLALDHWLMLDALQEYFAKHEKPELNMRELHDALEEKFHLQGGMKYLYKLFPGGPVAQGGRIAGIRVPAGTVDKSFGSVQ